MTLIKILLVLVVLLYVMIVVYAQRDSFNGGIVDGKLKTCPNSPNCISSYENEEPLKTDMETMLKALKKLNGKIISSDDRYIHAVFTSTFFRFQDDFEVLADGEVLQFRSASRTGKSDLGVNKKRLEKIKAVIEKTGF